MLKELLKEENIELDEEVIKLFELHLDYVLDANKSVRLTAIRDKDEGERLHIIDSLLVLPEVLDAPEGVMLDIGTGGGYPGYPIALASKRSADLLDSVQKKAKIVDSFLRDNPTEGIKINTIAERAENLAVSRPGYYSLVLARAVSSLPALVELASPLLAYSGRLVAHKGPFDQEELDRGVKVAEITGMNFINKREYTLSGDGKQRTVYVFEKIREPQITLPRRSGRAQRKPLA